MKRRLLAAPERTVYAAKHIHAVHVVSSLNAVMNYAWKEGIDFVVERELTNPNVCLIFAAGMGRKLGVSIAALQCKDTYPSYISTWIEGLESAARGGHTKIMQRLREMIGSIDGSWFHNGETADQNALQWAVWSGHIPTVRVALNVVLKNFADKPPSERVPLAASLRTAAEVPSRLRVLVYLRNQFRRELPQMIAPFVGAMTTACMNGNTSAMRLIYRWDNNRAYGRNPILWTMDESDRVGALKLAVSKFVKEFIDDTSMCTYRLESMLNTARAKKRVRCVRWLEKFIRKKLLGKACKSE